jgi:starch phosphorylase
MTLLALNTSKYVNGVAKKHGQVSQEMFPGYAIDSITNGVHSPTWTSESFKYLFDRFVTGWAKDPCSLRHAINIPTGEIWHAHEIEKRSLIEEVKRLTGESLDPGVFTIGFARRATEYKRSTLVFSDPNALLEIARTVGPIQLIFAGKAHPKDHGGKEAIRRIVTMAKSLGNLVKVVYLPNYGMALAKLLTAGVDLWLNTPLRPQEASGTSGMKAAHNGVPSLSVLDGWWIEGNIEGVTGWSVGGEKESSSTDAGHLYQRLRLLIVPMYYRHPEQWRQVMRQAIAFNASFFNTHRMVQQYVTNAYF